MSQDYWTNDGYGFKLGFVYDETYLNELVAKSNIDCLKRYYPTVESFFDLYAYEVAEILSAVISKKENITIDFFEDEDGEVYVLYTPSYPWSLNDTEKNLTKEKLNEIFEDYLDKLTEEAVEFDFFTVRNFG